MFKCKTDRLDYGELLVPPPGYELVKAVATTYALDLETLAAVSIILGTHESSGNIVADSPVVMLHSLQKVADKIVVFCESGQIKVPHKKSALMLMMEKMVVTVALPLKSYHFSSFHPKTWTLEYENDDKEKIFRFIVLSRNLTFDRSWDVAFMMEGVEEIEEDRHTKPLTCFMKYLAGLIDDDNVYAGHQSNIVDTLKKDLKHVHFSLGRHEFNDFAILPIGIGKHSADMSYDDLFMGYPYPQQGIPFQELTVISPFLSAETLEYLNSESLSRKGTRRKLFTRRSGLPGIRHVADNFDVYVLKDTVIDGESSLPERDYSIPQQQDIHAKMYLRSNDNHSSLYLGSMNATASGLTRNVEMLVRLDAKSKDINMDILCKDMFSETEDSIYNPFEKVDLGKLPDTDPERDEDTGLIKTLKLVCRMKTSCRVIQEDNTYSIELHFDTDKLPMNVQISPLGVDMFAVLERDMVFKGLDLKQLSVFFIVSIEGIENNLRRVLMIPVTGIPDSRDRSLVQETICNRKEFIEYVAIALGGDPVRLIGSRTAEQYRIPDSGTDFNMNMPALYEKMLRVASEDKKRLLDIESVMLMVDDKAVIPDDFREMYKTFKHALDI